MVLRLWWIALAACGRVGFDPGAADSALASPDAATCPASAVLCDDFESGNLAKWDGFDLSTGATTVVDGATVHAGMFAVDATLPASGGNGGAAAVCKSVTPQSSGMLAVRAWVFTPASLQNYNAVISMLGTPCGGNPPEYAQIDCNDVNAWTLADASAVGGLHDHSGTACMPPSTWTCVELDYTFGATPHGSVYMNDTMVVDTDTLDPAPAFVDVGVGVTRGNAVGFQAFIDDAVIAHSHIGCD